MKNDLTLKDLEEMFGMEQELDIPMKDRFHNTLTPEQLSILTEQEEKCKTDYRALEAKIKELEAKYGK